MASQTSFSKFSNEELCSLIRVKEIIDMFFKDACQKQIETSVMTSTAIDEFDDTLNYKTFDQISYQIKESLITNNMMNNLFLLKILLVMIMKIQQIL